MNLRYHLFNPEEIPVEEIETRARARAYAGLMAFKFVHLTDIQMRRLLKATIVADIPDEFREMLWRYILGHIPTEAEEISYTVKEGRRMRSVADELESRGLQRGLVKRRNLFWNS